MPLRLWRMDECSRRGLWLLAGTCIVIRVVCKCRLSVTYCKKVKRSKRVPGRVSESRRVRHRFGICGMVHSHGSQPCSEKASAPGRCATAHSDIREQSPWSVLPLKLRMKRRGPERQRLQVQRRRWEHPKPAQAQHSRCRIQQVHRRREHHISTRSRRSKRFLRREHHMHLYMGSSSSGSSSSSSSIASSGTLASAENLSSARRP